MAEVRNKNTEKAVGCEKVVQLCWQSRSHNPSPFGTLKVTLSHRCAVVDQPSNPDGGHVSWNKHFGQSVRVPITGVSTPTDMGATDLGEPILPGRQSQHHS